jgi:TFIIF-interacting CTD phosphatase-like protein
MYMTQELTEADASASAKEAALPRPLLILDLDETLVHARETALDRAPDFKQSSYFIYKRPFLAEFLTSVAAHYDLAVWSAAGTGYVEPTVKRLVADLPQPLELRFVWSFPRCTRRFNHEAHEEYYIKDLKKVRDRGFDLDRVLIVDDLERNSERNFGNAVYIKPFEGDLEDRELLNLADYLSDLSASSNFRTVEKRRWRNRYHK